MMSEHAWRTGGAGTDGSYSGFEVNQSAPLIEMEKGMTVQSGNDAAIALAEHIAGSEQAFAALMNAYAQRIGMKNTNFVNPHGLPHPEHYSTARDLAILGRAMIRDYPEHYAYNAIREYTVGSITQRNRNLLLWRDPSVDGIKTGHTSGAGYCLMTSAERGGQRLITVVLGSTGEKQRADDSQALLNWGFRFFETHTLYDAGKAVSTQKVWKGAADEVALGLAAPLAVTVQRGRYEQLEPTMDVPKTLVAPITRGRRSARSRSRSTARSWPSARWSRCRRWSPAASSSACGTASGSGGSRCEAAAGRLTLGPGRIAPIIGPWKSRPTTQSTASSFPAPSSSARWARPRRTSRPNCHGCCSMPESPWSRKR
jgi:serine-type D-Ala-D-Ala carboxypeptidase (penicillin-binding protein 5/6)